MRGQDIILDTLPGHNTSKIIAEDNYLFLQLDSSLFKLNDRLEKIYDHVTSLEWDDSSSKLLLQNPNEILLFDPQASNTPDLILRSISPIGSAHLNWYTGYVFFQNEGKIKAVELDGRDHRNIYTIVDALDDFTIDEKGKVLQVFDQKKMKEYSIR